MTNAIEIRGTRDDHRIVWASDLAIQDEVTIIWKGRVMRKSTMHGSWGRVDWGYHAGFRFIGWNGMDRLQIHYDYDINYRECSYGTATFQEHWFAVRYDKGSIRFYIDKIAVLTTSLTHSTIVYGNYAVHVGTLASTRRWRGNSYTKKVLIYNRALSDNEIYQIVDGKFIPDGLVVYFDFEKDGFNYYDRSGNNHTFRVKGHWVVMPKSRQVASLQQSTALRNTAVARIPALR